MLPGFSAELMPKGREKESQAKIKRYMTMMDSMTNEGKSSVLYLCFAPFWIRNIHIFVNSVESHINCGKG